MKHDFVSNDFKIKNQQQLDKLKRLGLKGIQYDPAKSDAEPLTPSTKKTKAVAPPDKSQLEKKARIKRIHKRRVSLQRCEKAYDESVAMVRKVMQTLMSQPAAAVEHAGELVSDMVDQLMGDEDAAMHLVSMKSKNESAYFHAINVTVLSLMLGKKLGLNSKQMNFLGIGALLHDLGHIEVPDKILRKKQPLTKPEQDFYQMHPVYGIRTAQRIGTVPAESLRIIGEHHEMVDGSGYPRGLIQQNISELAQIVAIINAYDNLCNQANPQLSVTPHEAMSTLYTRGKDKFDKEKLSHFISHMGVYPPGTVVKLDNGQLGSVVSINNKSLLQPNVLIYDPKVPCKEAIILNLHEEKLSIKESLSRNTLSPEIIEYLSLEDSVNYYFEPKSSAKNA